MLRFLCLAALVLSVSLVAGTTSAATSAAALDCPAGYSYAGLVSESALAGVAATVAASAPASAGGGHAAAWVNVGGRQDWLQIGITNSGDDQELYYETTRGGESTFHPLRPVALGQPVAIAVAALKSRPGWWRAYADHQAVTDFYLPRSKTGLMASVLAESYLRAAGACNSLSYSFTHVRVLAAPGARWQWPGALTPAQDPGFQLSRSRDTFHAAR
jgi:hypothetical protein